MGSTVAFQLSFFEDRRSFMGMTWSHLLYHKFSHNQSNLKHELPLVKTLLQREPRPPTSLVEFLSFIHPYKSAFDCLYRLLLIAVTSDSFKRSFSKMKIVKTFLRRLMTSERLSNFVLLSSESKRGESINLDRFVVTWSL